MRLVILVNRKKADAARNATENRRGREAFVRFFLPLQMQEIAAEDVCWTVKN